MAGTAIREPRDPRNSGKVAVAASAAFEAVIAIVNAATDGRVDGALAHHALTVVLVVAVAAILAMTSPGRG
ncbi:hypothetical protein [Actinoplanes sp. N902-109]|uniref:hypothetical protein n=1 Tax=Actinoplanes sp. (strain N902-109) TaxID=649831 RepID=UPI0003296485|nr:hypothetical protein [Actinoplanes sp. N902-109]AGL19783.1 hypothetical protein L083_6273 [Actinoplanes sp. N902-109]